MDLENYNQKDLSVGFWTANFFAVVITLPVLAVLYIFYTLIWGFPGFPFRFPYWAIYLLGVFVHELIHALTAVKFSQNGMKSIKLGIYWKFLTPYCHCKEPMKVKNYRLVLLAPMFVLGIIPTILGFIVGHNGVFAFGLLFILAGAGDFLIFWKIRNECVDDYAIDYADKIGCLIYQSKND